MAKTPRKHTSLTEALAIADTLRKDPKRFRHIGLPMATKMLSQELGFDILPAGLKRIASELEIPISAPHGGPRTRKSPLAEQADLLQCVCALRELMDELGVPKSNPRIYGRVRDLHIKLSPKD